MLTGGDVTSHIYGIRPSDYEPSTFFFLKLSDYPVHTHTLILSPFLSHVVVLVVQLCPTFCDPMDCSPLCPWDSSGKNTGVSSHSLLQGFFPTQESNPGLLHCRWILYHLSYQGSHTYTHKTVIYPPQLRKIFMSEKPGWAILVLHLY